jgi:hypothetical protein
MTSSSFSTSVNPLLGLLVSEKLTKLNYKLRHPQVKVVICGTKLPGFYIGDTKPLPAIISQKGETKKEIEVINMEYKDWEARTVAEAWTDI